MPPPTHRLQYPHSDHTSTDNHSEQTTAATLPTTDLYHLRARQYDPRLGRFLTRDTWPYDFQNPVELNRYGYTANNPVNYVDPSGYSATNGYVGTLKTVAGNFWRYVNTPSVRKAAISGMISSLIGYHLGLFVNVSESYTFNHDSRFVRTYTRIANLFYHDMIITAITGGLLGISSHWVGVKFPISSQGAIGFAGAINTITSTIGQTFTQFVFATNILGISNILLGISNILSSIINGLDAGNVVQIFQEIISDVGIGLSAAIAGGAALTATSFRKFTVPGLGITIDLSIVASIAIDVYIRNKQSEIDSNYGTE